MRKKVLSAVLSIMMFATSFTPAFGAEFSSGEEESVIVTEECGSEQEDAFSDGEETGVSQEIFFDGSEEELGIELDEEEPVYQAATTNTAPTSEKAEQIVAGQEYTGVVTEEEKYHWYKFIPEESGVYKSSIYCSLDEEDDLWMDFYECQYEVYLENDLEEYIYKYYDDEENKDHGFSAYKGTVYYIKFSFETLREYHFKLVSTNINYYDIAEQITTDQIYTGKISEAEDRNERCRWYKFVPKKDGQYDILLNLVSVKGNVDEAECQFRVYSESNLNNEIDESYFCGGTPYYIKVFITDWWQDERLLGDFTLKIERNMTDKDYIEEILEERGSLPQIKEADNMGEKFSTPAVLYEDDKTFMQFIPKYTGTYRISGNIKDNGRPWILYDNQFNLLEIQSGKRKWSEYSMLQGKTYYFVIGNYVAKEELKNFIYEVQYVPAVSSFKILEGPSRKTLYRGVDCITTSPSGDYGEWLPGLKFEVIYENGKKEIIAAKDAYMSGNYYNDGAGMYEYGIFSDYSGDKLVPAPGIYSIIISMGEKKIEIGDVTVKDLKDLPLIDGQGSADFITGVKYQNGCILLKVKETGKYIVSNSAGADMNIFTNENVDSVNGCPYEYMMTDVKQNSQVSLDAGKDYYIECSELKSDKVTITVNSAEKKDLSKSKVTVSTVVSYTGKAITPTVKVTYGTDTLKKDIDYTISYSNNTSIGTATITLTGKGNYIGTVKKNFTIKLGVPTVKTVESAGYNATKIIWNTIPGAKTYTLYYKGGSVKNWKAVKSGITGTSYKHVSSKSSPLTTGTIYTYTVKAVNGKDTSDYGTSTKKAKPLPAEPKLGKVTSVAYNKQKITWSKVAGATGYIVYQKINGKWVKIGTTKTTSYINTHSSKHPVLTGTTNTYTVKAYRTVNKKNVAGSCSQKGISGQAVLTKPVISKVSKISKGLKLEWKKISGANGYIIQRYDSGKWVTKKTVTSGKVLTYTDTTAQKGKTYKYRIAAYRTINKKKILSSYSAVKSGKR